jgi:hypothetical protein
MLIVEDSVEVVFTWYFVVGNSIDNVHFPISNPAFFFRISREPKKLIDFKKRYCCVCIMYNEQVVITKQKQEKDLILLYSYVELIYTK